MKTLDFILPYLSILFYQTVVSAVCMCEGMKQCKTFLIMSFKGLKNTEILKYRKKDEMISNWNACFEKAKGLRTRITKSVKCRKAELSLVAWSEMASPVNSNSSCVWLRRGSQQEGGDMPFRQREQQVRVFCVGPEYLGYGN